MTLFSRNSLCAGCAVVALSAVFVGCRRKQPAPAPIAPVVPAASEASAPAAKELGTDAAARAEDPVGGARRADGQDIYWRMAQFALPSHSTTPSTLPG